MRTPTPGWLSKVGSPSGLRQAWVSEHGSPSFQTILCKTEQIPIDMSLIHSRQCKDRRGNAAETQIVRFLVIINLPVLTSTFDKCHGDIRWMLTLGEAGQRGCVCLCSLCRPGHKDFFLGSGTKNNSIHIKKPNQSRIVHGTDRIPIQQPVSFLCPRPMPLGPRPMSNATEMFGFCTKFWVWLFL